MSKPMLVLTKVLRVAFMMVPVENVQMKFDPLLLIALSPQSTRHIGTHSAM